ncbi:MAG: membrane protein insertase YidC [Flavobacteriales bacterium]|nr:membrane protein insertase YidC [Flavobacteriales bacterium]
MDKNTIIGFVLIAAILVGYTWWTAPSPEELQRMQQQQDSIEQVQRAVVEEKKAQAEALDSVKQQNEVEALIAELDSAQLDTLNRDSLAQVARRGRFGVFHPAGFGEPNEFTLENELLEVTFSSKGARPERIRLKNYSTYRGGPLLLQDPGEGKFEYRFFTGNLDLSTADLHFTAEPVGTHAVRFKAPTEDPASYLAITYTLDSAGYFLHSDLDLVGLESTVDPGNLFFRWELFGLGKEKHLPTERQKCGVYYKYFNDDRDYLSESGDDEKLLQGRTNWVAFKQDFFTVAMVSEEGFAGNGAELRIAVNEEDTTHTKKYSAKLFFEKEADAKVNVPMRFFLGPNHFGTLRRTEIDQFSKIIDLGWGIFGWMNRWIVIPIFNSLDGLNWSYGLIILVLTVVIKLMLMPLTYKNFKSSARMRVLKPEMEAITEKYKDGDQLKKQQAVMDLYRRAGVNPASGCVPMLIQMPILYAMFRFFPASIELRQEKFLWADDLSSYDSILDLPFEIPFYGDHVSLFTLLMAASTIVYQLMNQQQMPQQQGMPSMKVMMWMFPIMMLFFLNNFSSGLSYYYLLANVISILQMTVFKNWLIDEEKLRAQLLVNMKTPKKKSRWQARLEELQKQQQQQSRKRKR